MPGLGRGERSQGTIGGALVVLVALAAVGLSDVNHVVVAGETLWSIAQRYATTPQAIASANHLANPDLILIGENLRISGITPATPATAPVMPARPAVVHTVVAGDNLTVIAARYGVTPQALASFNGIDNANFLRIGQALRIPSPPISEVEALLDRYAKTYGISAALVKAVAWQESGWQEPVVSPVGAMGVMQIMPKTGTFAATYLVRHPVDPLNVEANVEAGVAFLAYLLRLSAGNAPLAVAAYYQGFDSVVTRGMYLDTKAYVANVIALEQRFSG